MKVKNKTILTITSISLIGLTIGTFINLLTYNYIATIYSIVAWISVYIMKDYMVRYLTAINGFKWVRLIS